MEPIAPITIVPRRGVVLGYGDVAPPPQRGRALDQGNVYEEMPGTVIMGQGKGERIFTGVRPSGKRGTLLLDVVMPPSGWPESICALGDMDSNQFFLVGKQYVNQIGVALVWNGNPIYFADADGPVCPAGSRVTIRLAWDCETPIYKGNHVFLKVNDSIFPNDEWQIGQATWPAFSPDRISTGLPFNMFGDFKGDVLRYAVSDEVHLDLDGDSAEGSFFTATMLAYALFEGDPTENETATSVGNSAVAADLTAVWDTDAAAVGGSAISASLTNV